jgi:hypothetical protein
MARAGSVKTMEEAQSVHFPGFLQLFGKLKKKLTHQKREHRVGHHRDHLDGQDEEYHLAAHEINSRQRIARHRIEQDVAGGGDHRNQQAVIHHLRNKIERDETLCMDGSFSEEGGKEATCQLLVKRASAALSRPPDIGIRPSTRLLIRIIERKKWLSCGFSAQPLFIE